MAGHPLPIPIPIPGQHPGQMPPPPPPPLHPQQQQPFINQVQAPLASYGLPLYVGYVLTPMKLLDGKPSWEKLESTQKMLENQTELASIAKKNPYKATDPQQAKNLSGNKKIHLDRMLVEYRMREPDPQTEWKLAGVRLFQKETITGMALLVSSHRITTKMQVIFKKVARTPPRVTHENFVVQQQQQQLEQQQHAIRAMHAQQMQQAEVLRQQQAHIQQQAQSQNLHPGQVISDERLPEGMRRFDNGHEVISESDFSEDDRHRSKDKKKDRRSSSPVIHIPDLRDHGRHRRDSRTSSRPTSYTDSDAFSHYESPLTSLASSPQNYSTDPKRRSSHNSHGNSKHYHGRKESSTSHRSGNRKHRDSTGAHSNDSFVMINKTNHHSHGNKHGHSSSSSYRARDIEDWNESTQLSPQRRRGVSGDRSLAREWEKLKITDLEHRAERQREVQHQVEINDRLRKLEDTIIHHGDDHRLVSGGDRLGDRLGERVVVDRHGVPLGDRLGDRYPGAGIGIGPTYGTTRMAIADRAFGDRGVSYGYVPRRREW